MQPERDPLGRDVDRRDARVLEVNAEAEVRDEAQVEGATDVVAEAAVASGEVARTARPPVADLTPAVAEVAVDDGDDELPEGEAGAAGDAVHVPAELVARVVVRPEVVVRVDDLGREADAGEAHLLAEAHLEAAAALEGVGAARDVDAHRDGALEVEPELQRVGRFAVLVVVPAAVGRGRGRRLVVVPAGGRGAIAVVVTVITLRAGTAGCEQDAGERGRPYDGCRQRTGHATGRPRESHEEHLRLWLDGVPDAEFPSKCTSGRGVSPRQVAPPGPPIPPHARPHASASQGAS